MRKRSSCLSWMLLFTTLAALTLLALVYFIPLAAENSFDAPSPQLNPWQRLSTAAELLWNAANLSQPVNPAGTGQLFTIQAGESAPSISIRLEQAGLIRSAATWRAYLIWSGIDTHLQTGTYRISPAQTGVEIAQMLKSSTLTEVSFTVLAGWRMEEIAASLPTSGMTIPAQEFISAVVSPRLPFDLLSAGESAEGFLFPGTYILPRTTTAEQLVSTLMEGFRSHLSPEMEAAYAQQGLSLYQAVILASIVERETVEESEMPQIASVFFNRLAIGMPLQTDPTVQYALGYNAVQHTWWTNPLSSTDMHVDSPYNTYIYAGLPPTPISNPSLAALQAVATPAQTAYYYFQARCDGSGWHNFAETFEQHQQNYCP